MEVTGLNGQALLRQFLHYTRLRTSSTTTLLPLMWMKWSGPMFSGGSKPTYASTCHQGFTPKFLINLPTQLSKIDGTSLSSSTLEPLAALQFLITGLHSLRPALMRTNPQSLSWQSWMRPKSTLPMQKWVSLTLNIASLYFMLSLTPMKCSLPQSSPSATPPTFTQAT